MHTRTDDTLADEPGIRRNGRRKMFRDSSVRIK